MSQARHFFVIFLLALSCLTQAHAEPAPYPPDRPALTLYLADGRHQAFSLEDLQRLPQDSIRLRDAQGGVQEWVGVPLDRLLASVPGADSGQTLHTTALNNYSVLIPHEDIQRYRPLIAYKRDGRFLAIRDYGPLYLIYPFDDHPELHQQIFYNRSIWQLSEIHLE